MLRNDPDYRRLKVGGTGAFGSASYWVGPDHLLVVVMSGYVENYRRFMYSDIQALIVRKTRLHYLLGFAAAFVAICCFWGAFSVVQGSAFTSLSVDALIGFMVLLTLGAIGLMIVFVNWLKGPSCICQLRTAVQTRTLPHLGRWRRAQQLIEELRPLILAAQPAGSPQPSPVESTTPAADQPTASAAPSPGPVAEPGNVGYVVDDPNAPPRIVP